VIFHLPDGTSVEHEARVGQSVEQLKGWLSSKVETAPFESQNLYYQDKLMPDPFCLNDIPVNPNEDCHIKVEIKT